MSADGKTSFKFNRWKQAEEEDKKLSYLPTHYGKNKKSKTSLLTCTDPKYFDKKFEEQYACDWENFVQI